MKKIKLSDRLNYLHKKLNGSTLSYDVSGYQKTVKTIREKLSCYSNYSEFELKEAVKKIKQDFLNKNFQTEDLFAVTAEIVKRKFSIDIYDTQLIGALALKDGKLIEMQTGEGKTLTAVFPVIYNCLVLGSVHIFTFNDYLAKRDALWMKPIYDFWELKVGYINQKMNKTERKKCYESDIVYLTAKEAGFDYLRDSIVYDKQEMVQRELISVIIDEADSILLDEARSPLIIAGSSDENFTEEKDLSEFVKGLKKDIDLKFDENERNFYFTGSGIKKAESFFNCENVYDDLNINKLTLLNCAVHAEFLFRKDVDYIVRNNKIKLIDEFTGRVAEKRRWPDGLQEALEQKEKLNIQQKGKILNFISLQHFIRFYKNVSAMTATAAISEEEFTRFYDLDTLVIPTSKKCIREDLPDRIFQNIKLKYKSVIEKIIEIHLTGQPVLVGTGSVAESEFLYEQLKAKNISCNVLNAKNDELEAELVASAGKLNAVTISTNMAGRGTDIKLGGENHYEKEQVKKLGGLFVIGLNRFESRRIDNQLRGRSGRQGDPGSSQFFISLEDDLFQKYNLNKLLPERFIFSGDDKELSGKIVRNEIARIQRIIEGQNLEIKKTVCCYSDLIEKQRKIFSEFRHIILTGKKNNGFEKNLLILDRFWETHIARSGDLKEGIHFMRLSGEDPFYHYQKNIVSYFELELNELKEKVKNSFDSKEQTILTENEKKPSSTWTYLINDDPFENIVGNMLSGNQNIGMSIGLLMTWPLLLIMPLIKKLKEKRVN